MLRAALCTVYTHRTQAGAAVVGLAAGLRLAHSRRPTSTTAILAAAAVPGAGPTAPPTVPPPPHIPVLLDEVVAAFDGVRLGVYLDGTLGAAGHASALASAHPEMHTLIGLDVDPVARAAAGARLERVVAERERARAGAGGGETAPSPLAVHVRAANFRGLAAELGAVGCGPVDGILLDLGFSSMQIDDPARGFSLAKDGPLDMRMTGPDDSSPPGSLSAADIVNGWPEGDLSDLFERAGEERAARTFAARLVAARASAPITTTAQLVAALGLAGWKKQRSKAKGGKGATSAPPAIHPATRVFQALRIGANDELGALDAALPAALDALAPGGRLGVISFHSLEDRAVKRAFLAAAGKGGGGEEEGGACGGGGDRWERAARAAWGAAPPPPPPTPTVRILTRKPLTAGSAEVGANPRARSAKLRVVEKL